MRHSSFKALAFTAAAGSAILFAGCSSEPILPDKAEEYSREFIKNFGVFDQSHDWNQATQVSVAVTTARPTDIKVYAMVDGTRYLFSTYLNVNGQRTLNVDVPKGITELIVRADGMDYKVKAGGAVVLASRSRTILGSESESTTTEDGLTWKIAPKKIFRTVATKTYLATYGENDPTNLSKGTNSFYFIADGNPHTFYPFYWQTNANHILGIYVVDDKDPRYITLHDLYYTKSGELLMSTNHQPGNPILRKKGNEQRLFTQGKYANLPDYVTYVGTEQNTSWASLCTNLFNENAEKDEDYKKTKLVDFTAENYIFKTTHGYISQILRIYYNYNVEYLFYETPFEDYTEEVPPYNRGTWKSVNTSSDPAYAASASTYVETRGITYKLEIGTRYGFYLKKNPKGVVTDGNNEEYDFIIFSNAERNAKPFYDSNNDVRNEKITENSWMDCAWWGDSGADEDDKYAYASWGVARMLGLQYTMFGFEDWPACDNLSSKIEGADLNDVMFLYDADAQPSSVVDVNKDGGVFSWIIACEDLGTDDFDFNDVVFEVSNPVYDDAKNIKTVDITALAAGGTLPVYLHYNGKVIGDEFHNWFGGSYSSRDVINAETYNVKGKTQTIEVSTDFTLGCCKSVTSDGGSGNMGGFKIEVKHADGSEVISAANPNLSGAIGTAPQMLCLPGTWFWPKENVCISEVYSAFKDWCEDHNTNHEWHLNATGRYVYRAVSVDSGIGDGSYAK